MGNDTPLAGQLTLNDAVSSNGFTSVLGTNNLTANRNISLPNASGTICLEGSVSCGFIALAPTSAQADNTTNNSIFINKTGTSGNLILLQKNGSDVFSVGNDGATTLRLNSATAFGVLNGSGVPILTVDTNTGTVRIGNSTADANGNLLVLDTKNTVGDPTGQNGGMYYNSFSNAMRCYENNIWKNCIDETTVIKTADQSVNNSTTFANDTNLAFAMLANSSYTINASINYSSTNGTADFKYTFTLPAGATVHLNTDGPTGITTSTKCNISSSGQTCALNLAGAYRGTININGYIRTGATAGNLQFQFAQNAISGGQSVTVYQGSMLSYRKTQ